MRFNREQQDSTESLDSYIEKWEKALADGAFESKKPPTPSSHSAGQSSFFGLDSKSTRAEVSDEDLKTWDQIYRNELEDEGMLQEATEDVKKTTKDRLSSPNPIYPYSTGKDQEMGKKQLGLTYSPNELRELAELKINLHDLQDKLNSFEGKGQVSKQLESKIASLHKKIDELSDSLNQIIPE